QPGWLPDGLRYVASWVTEDFRRCFQVMECEDRALLTQWTARWDDLIEFEVLPVTTSSVPVVAGFVLLGAAVLVGRSLLDVGRRLLETKPRAAQGSVGEAALPRGWFFTCHRWSSARGHARAAWRSRAGGLRARGRYASRAGAPR